MLLSISGRSSGIDRGMRTFSACGMESLRLTAENDYDSDGRALMDEFLDAISACIAEGFDGDIRVASVKEL